MADCQVYDLNHLWTDCLVTGSQLKTPRLYQVWDNVYNGVSASPFLSRFTSSSTCQPRSRHPSLQAQNLPFQQILPTLDFFYLLDCLTIKGLERTYHAHHFIFSLTF